MTETLSEILALYYMKHALLWCGFFLPRLNRSFDFFILLLPPIPIIQIFYFWSDLLPNWDFGNDDFVLPYNKQYWLNQWSVCSYIHHWIWLDVLFIFFLTPVNYSHTSKKYFLNSLLLHLPFTNMQNRWCLTKTPFMQRK